MVSRTVSASCDTASSALDPFGLSGGTGGQNDFFFLPDVPYSSPDSEQQLVLLRQALLTAHEVGHSLGFSHN